MNPKQPEIKPIEFTTAELSTYSQLQIDVLNNKLYLPYSSVVAKFNFSSKQQLGEFLFRTFLGFKQISVESNSGPIPLVPDVVTLEFVAQCEASAEELNCLHTHKALYILEEKMAERAFRGYSLATKLKCPILANEIVNRIQGTTVSSQWFNHYCKENNLKLLNAQNLEEVRQKYCNETVLRLFYQLLGNFIHSIDGLIYNMDETYCDFNKKGKLVVPQGKYPVVSEEHRIGHVTCICTINAAGMAWKPFIILPMLQNLPEELREFQTQCIFASSPSGWITSKIFLIWCLFFIGEINKHREILRATYGDKAKTTPCVLIVDGHKSRINSEAIELLFMNNIQLIILPAHTSHVTQPFDICVAAPLKLSLQKFSDNPPLWAKQRVEKLCETAKKRYLLVLNVIDAWKQAASTRNVKMGFFKAGIVPFNVDEPLKNAFVNKVNTQIPAPSRKGIQINGYELTSFPKRLEISRHCALNPWINAPLSPKPYNQMYNYIRTGKEKILSFHEAQPICFQHNNLRYYYL